MTRRKVALTFDAEAGEDLPGHNVGAAGWARVLDVLRRHQVRSTFFLQADWVARHPGLARRTADEGHLLGNHTLNHLDLLEHPDQALDQVVTGGKVIAAVTGTEVTPWFRLPYFAGNRSSSVLALLGAAGWEHVDRNCEALDWELRADSAARVLHNVLADAAVVEGPLVVLLHTWPPAAAAGAELLIRRLGDQDVDFVTVDELSAQERAGVELPREVSQASGPTPQVADCESRSSM